MLTVSIVGYLSSRTKLRTCAVFGSMTPNWLQFSINFIGKSWSPIGHYGQIMALICTIILYLVHVLNFCSLWVYGSNCRLNSWIWQLSTTQSQTVNFTISVCVVKATVKLTQISSKITSQPFKSLCRSCKK